MRYFRRKKTSPKQHTDVKTTTRDAIADQLLEGPLTAANIAENLDLTTAAVRRHLDIMVDEGIAESVEPSPYEERGRGRPAKLFHLSEKGRAAFGHGYDYLAVDALQTIRKIGGEATLLEFALSHMKKIVEGVEPLPANPTRQQVEKCAAEIANAFDKSGFATSIGNAQGGIQICHHHCPIAQVAHEFPVLCLAEYQVISELLQSPIQRLSTIAHGAHTCTTNVSTGTPINLAINEEQEDA